jgi:predicted SprT family Zn-dependent metalloprotease
MNYLEKITLRIEKTQIKLQAMGYDRIEIPNVLVTKLGKGTSGQASYYPTRTIKISVDYIREFEEQILNRTVPHEVVHHYVNKYFPRARQHHGPEFRNIMRALGCDCATKHSMHLSKPQTGGRTVVRHLYKTELTLKLIRLTTGQHKKILMNPNRFTAHGEKLIYTGKMVNV